MRRRVSGAMLILLVAVATAAGLLVPVDQQLQDLRFQLSERAPSGDIVLVQIDAKSLDEVGVWPWPRSVHARVIDILREAGARNIALDIDFSHASGRVEEDVALAAALQRADGSVILPAFRQPQVAGDPNSAIITSQPLPHFARHSWPAVVNIWPEADGIVRELEYSSQLNGKSTPSLALLVAGGNGIKNKRFGVDFSITPSAIPRISVADVLNSEVDLSGISGKSVIVGATALELGDRVVVPVHGILTGPELQVLAAETLVQGRAVAASRAGFVYVCLAVLLAGLLASAVLPSWRRDVFLWPVVAAAIELVAFAAFHYWAISINTAPLHALILGYLVWRASVEIDFRGLVAKFTAIERDNSELLLERVMNDSFDAVIIVDDSEKVLMVNRSAQEFLRDGKSAVGSVMLHEILLPEFATHALQAISEVKLSASRIVGREFSVQDDGKTRHLELNATRSKMSGEGDRHVVTLTIHDITARRLAANAIERAASEAHAANRAKSSFLAAVSHELRTPLNAIIGFSGILGQEMFGKLGDPHYKEYVDHITESGAHLLRIVNNILDITRIEAGNLSLQEDEISLRTLFEFMTTTVSGLPGGSTRQFATSVEPGNLTVLADPQVLRQIMLNLLSNAVKFTTAAEGKITMRATLDGDGALRIAVSDNGTGIDPQHLPNLTKPFYQVDGKLARQHEGAGLGLALVSGFVAAHGGYLEIDSRPGEGTTVAIVLPAARVIARRNAA